jgi:16S rRNA (uracil1498-N3)-methyltransferase
MSTPYLFIHPEQADGRTIYIDDPDDIRHLYSSLRIRPGDRLYVSDDNRFQYITEVRSLDKGRAVLEIKSSLSIDAGGPGIILYQCILKKKAMELVIQKATEIGVSMIVPVISSRSISHAGGNDTKIERWQKISDEASKQSKRDFKCQLKMPVSLKDIDIGSYDYFFVPYEHASKDMDGTCILEAASRAASIAYLIGPEGGFSPDEAGYLSDKKAVILRLGGNILRAETAAAYFLSVIDFCIRQKV